MIESPYKYAMSVVTLLFPGILYQTGVFHGDSPILLPEIESAAYLANQSWTINYPDVPPTQFPNSLRQKFITNLEVESVPTISVVVIGAYQLDVSTTIEDLIGPTHKNCGNFPNLTPKSHEFVHQLSLRFDHSGKTLFQLKFAGFVLATSHPEQDAKTMSSLKSYLAQNRHPTLFLIVLPADGILLSRDFDKTQRFLERIDFLQSILHLNENNFKFIIRPSDNLNVSPAFVETECKSVLQNFTNFRMEATSILIDSKILFHIVIRERLITYFINFFNPPSRNQVFARQIWKSFHNTTMSWNNDLGSGVIIYPWILQWMVERKTKDLICSSATLALHPDTVFDDMVAFKFILEQPSTTPEANEIYHRIDAVLEACWSNLDFLVQKRAVQLMLQKLYTPQFSGLSLEDRAEYFKMFHPQNPLEAEVILKALGTDVLECLDVLQISKKFEAGIQETRWCPDVFNLLLDEIEVKVMKKTEITPPKIDAVEQIPKFLTAERDSKKWNVDHIIDLVLMLFLIVLPPCCLFHLKSETKSPKEARPEGSDEYSNSDKESSEGSEDFEDAETNDKPRAGGSSEE